MGQIEPLTRIDTVEATNSLRAGGCEVAILSGERPETVIRLAQGLDIPASAAEGGMFPDERMSWVKARQAEGGRVLMIGDGINDAPVPSVQDISVSLSEATDLARQTADFIILTGDMRTLAHLVTGARRTTGIIRQNLGWALTCSLTAIRAAALGYVLPWLAAIGMSLSSFIVVGNALRLRR
jgi:Cu2+-exporting ATPase